MTPELQRYYEEVIAMFKSDAWKAFAEDVERMRKESADVRRCDDLAFAKGQLDILDWFVNAPGLYERAYQQLQEESTQ